MMDSENESPRAEVHTGEVSVDIYNQGEHIQATEQRSFDQKQQRQSQASSSSKKTSKKNDGPKKQKQSVFIVAGEKTKATFPDSSEVDANSRDPEEINQHIKVAFPEIFAEPHDSIFSFDIIWQLAYQCFFFVKLWTYRICTLIFAIPAAVLWAIFFACLSFTQIWCCMPIYRGFLINLVIVQKFLTVIMDCCLTPITMALGKIFSSIRVTVIKGDNTETV